MGKLLLVIKVLDNNLKYCRENLEMTQEELGYVFGVHKTTISGWETGKDIIPLKKLIKFCDMYNYSVDFAMGLTRDNIEYQKTKIDKVIVGQNLKKIRKSLNLSQEQIAEECAIYQTTYSNYETGLYLISTIALYTICKKHKISADLILGRKK